MKIALSVVAAITAVMDHCQPAMTEDQITGTASALKYVIERLPIGDSEYRVLQEYENLILSTASRYSGVGRQKPSFEEAHRYAARLVLDIAHLRWSLNEEIRGLEFVSYATAEIDRQLRSLMEPVNSPPRKSMRTLLEEFGKDAAAVLDEDACRFPKA